MMPVENVAQAAAEAVVAEETYDDDFLVAIEDASLSAEVAAARAEEQLTKSLLADGTMPADMEARIAEALCRLERTANLITKLVPGASAAVSAREALDQVDANLRSLVDAGDLIERPRFLEKIGWSRQALSKAVSEKRLFFVQIADERAFPSFYLDSNYERKQLEAVTRLLGDLSGGSKWLFFTTPKGSLAKGAMDSSGAAKCGIARTPLQALRAGDLEAVKRAAVGATQR